MIKPELIQEIANKTRLSKKKIELVVDTMLNTIEEEVGKGNKVLISGFGVFYSAHRKARKGINPNTKEKMDILGMELPKFKPGTKFKRVVQNKK
jgi:DNA-binding protein HU-beta